MSHKEALELFRLVAEINKELIPISRTLEIGSFDVNGSIREIYNQSLSYVGVDIADGPGVDVVSLGHKYDPGDLTYDIVLSAECFEHDPYWQLTLKNMLRLLRPGGLVVVSCAAPGRVEHGTFRTRLSDSPGTVFLDNHYQNIKSVEFENVVRSFGLVENYVCHVNKASSDLYFVGIKQGKSEKQFFIIPPIDRIVKVTNSTFITHLKRIPNYILKGLNLSDQNYQNLSIKLGKFMQKLKRIQNT
jgi:SAM-dependent methyltransferase